MENIKQTFYAEFLEKNAQLEAVKAKLKQEFVGINSVIDEVVENIRPWYITPQLQDKPLVLNLWGLTGTGKTTLVQRLFELLEFDNLLYRFDMAEKRGDFSFSAIARELAHSESNDPIIVVLDEFQHARTKLSEYGAEVEIEHNRLIWEFIDTGDVQYNEFDYSRYDIVDLLEQLNYLHRQGIQVENGLVVTMQETFIKELNLKESESSELHFIQSNNLNNLVRACKGYYNFKSKKHAREFFNTKDALETIDFLKGVVRFINAPKKKSFANCLIFILGNLDEAYTMSGYVHADLSADEFHENSLKITVPDIKQALRMRFRDEQIARLGNIHIIYPALNSNAYYGLIQLEFEKLKSKFRTEVGIEMHLDASLIEEVYQEGVYPTQGARPLFTTIHQMVKSKLSSFIYELMVQGFEANKLQLLVADKHLVGEFFNSTSQLVFTTKSPITYTLNNLRETKSCEDQAISAVHEAGHAVVLAALLKRVPKAVLSVTSDKSAMGLTNIAESKKYYAKHEVLNFAALYLGGVVAEEVVFGAENITTGASHDIYAATHFLTDVYKRQGFGELTILYAESPNENSSSYHSIQSVEEEIKTAIVRAKELAFATLKKHKKLLLKLAEFLTQNSKIEELDLKALVKNYSTIELKNVNEDNFYRATLVAELDALNAIDAKLELINQFKKAI